MINSTVLPHALLREGSIDEPRHVFDAASGLTVFIVLLLALPSSLRIPALGGVGYLAAIWAMMLGLWWCWATVMEARRRPAHPVRVAMFTLLASCLLGYAWAMRRPLPPIEASQADIGMLRIVVAASIVLISIDGVASWPRLLLLLRRLSLAVGLFGALGILQFVTHRSLIAWISLPGFVQTQAFSNLIDRGGLTRAASTAMHPLEYSAALSAVFPIALTLALFDKAMPISRRVGPAIAIATALAVSGSRSAYLGLVVGLLLLAIAWPRAIRVRMAGVAGVFVGAVGLGIPGLTGTVRGMFLHVATDPSALSRSGSYAIVGGFLERSPFVGRGFGTFLPTYRILDNQWLLLVVELGLIGATAFVALIVTAAWSARSTAQLLHDPLDRQLGYSLVAALVSITVLLGFFDAFAFPIAAGVFFLVVGLCGAFLACGRSAGGRTRPPADRRTQ